MEYAASTVGIHLPSFNLTVPVTLLRLGTWMNGGDLYELENPGPVEYQEDKYQEDKAKRSWQSTHSQDEQYCVGNGEVILNERRQK